MTFLHPLLLAITGMFCLTAQAQTDEFDLLDARDPDQIELEISHAAMGTDFVFRLYGSQERMDQPQLAAACAKAFSAIDAIEQQVSNWIPESECSRVNSLAGREPVAVGEDMLRLLRYSWKTYQQTGGAFDITVGPLIKLWGFYKNEGHFPSESEMTNALSLIGLNKVTLNGFNDTVSFEKEGMSIDFGGIGKGDALDIAAKILRKNGVERAILHSGTSSVVTIGAPPGGGGWPLKVRNPLGTLEESVDEISLLDESLSTAGADGRFFEIEGKKYGHIFDPQTGMPVGNPLSVSVIAPTGIETDALDTAFLVMGIEKIRAYCEEHPHVRAIAVVLENGLPVPIRINFPPSEEEQLKAGSVRSVVSGDS